MKGGWALVCLVGCTEHVFVPYPDSNALTELLLLGRAGKLEPDRVEVIDLQSARPVVIDLTAYDLVEAWTFDETVADLGVENGYQHLGEAVDPTRYVSHVWVGDVWRAVPASAWASFVLLPSPVDCIESGGCAHESGCSLPCPSQPEPLVPAAVLEVDPTCPSTWPRSASGACEPWRFDPTSCTGLTAAIPGADACVPLGTACAGKWPNVGPVSTVFVEEGAAGIGTIDDPLGRIDQALAIAAQTIALSGTFAENVFVDGPIEIVGCPGTVIQGQVTIRGQATLAGLTISGGTLVVESGASALVAGVAIDTGTSSTAVVSAGNTVMYEVVVRSGSTALVVPAAGRMEGTRVEVRGVDGALVQGELSLAEASVQPALGEMSGRGIFVDGGTLHLQETVIEGWAGDAVALESGFADLRRVVARRTAGLVAAETTLFVSDSMFIDSVGRHLSLRTSSTTVERSILSGSTGTDDQGRGEAVVASGGSVDLRQTVIRDTDGDAIYLDGAGSMLIDVIIEGARGRGIYGTPLRLSASRIAISDVVGRAIDIHNGNLTFVDLVIRNVGTSLCEVCSGICASDSGRPAVVRAVVERASGAGVGAFGGNALVHGIDLAVRDTLAPGDCSVPPDPGMTSAGVTARDGALINLQRFLVEENDKAGISVYRSPGESARPRLVLNGGTIRRNPIGLLLRVPDFDLSQVHSVLLDNVENLSR